MEKYVIIMIFCFSVFHLKGQESTDTTSLYRENALNIYISCDYCDEDYFKENFKIVNYVRDRKVADVHIIISEMRTGSGGTEYMIQFTGQKRFRALNDTIVYSLKADYTDDEERVEQLKYIRLGLVPYILKTPFSDKLNLKIKEEDEAVEEKDKWKNWVFKLYSRGFANGEKTYKYYRLSSGVSAQKVTPDIKIELNLNSFYTEQRFRLYENDSLVYSKNTYRKIYYSNNLITKSIGKHWGIGGFLYLKNSTYSNLDFRASILPAVEYNLFKYSEASRKQLRFLYSAGFEYSDYTDTTIYNKTEDRLFRQTLSITLKYIVNWGSIDATVYGANYLHDFSLFQLGTYVGSEIRIFKGLSFTLYGGLNMPRDQITLTKGTTSAEDVLTRQHEMETDYNFWGNIGLRYTFGSIYNNVVNPRFDMDY
jgi:hypothetical protein